jgi:hypothetical protein
MANDGYCCVVCGAADGLYQIYDHTCAAVVCWSHKSQIEKQWSTVPLKPQLRELGVKFGDEPMDLLLSDEDFCKQCGIKKPEKYEMWAAFHEDDKRLKD